MFKALATFVLIGTVDSTDQFFASVEINTNPPQEQPSLAVLPLTAFPCKIEEGDTFYIFKSSPDKLPVIMCAGDQEEPQQ